MKIDIKKANIVNLTKEEKQKLYEACTSFANKSGYDDFFHHIENLWLSSILGINEARGKSAATLISDDYFRGGLEAIHFIKSNITEYAQVSCLNKSSNS